MTNPLALEDPRWQDLATPAGKSARTVERVRELAAARRFGPAWERLRDLIIHQGTIYPATYAVLPHVVAIASELEPATLGDLWIDLGFVVASIDSRPWRDAPADLVPACDAAIDRALGLALVAWERSRGRAALRARDAGDLALACVAFARHRVGQLIWAFAAPPKPGKELVEQLFCTAMCPACVAELEWMHCGDGIIEYGVGRVGQTRPDPQPPIVLPPVPALRGDAGPWSVVAHALAASPGVIGGEIARVVAGAGVPRAAPDRAVIAMVAAMIGVAGQPDWAGRFARLASDMRCPACGVTSPFAHCLPRLRIA